MILWDFPVSQRVILLSVFVKVVSYSNETLRQIFWKWKIETLRLRTIEKSVNLNKLLRVEIYFL